MPTISTAANPTSSLVSFEKWLEEIIQSMAPGLKAQESFYEMNHSTSSSVSPEELEESVAWAKEGGQIQTQEQEILQALKDGHYYSSQGPELHNVTLRGKEIEISCSPVDTITVVCGTSRSCVKIGKSITAATFDLSTMEKGWLLKKPSPWLRVTVIDHAGKCAWSNPYWWDDFA